MISWILWGFFLASKPLSLNTFLWTLTIHEKTKRSAVWPCFGQLWWEPNVSQANSSLATCPSSFYGLDPFVVMFLILATLPSTKKNIVSYSPVAPLK